MQYALVLTTYPEEEAAKLFAEKIIKAKLAACINVLPEMSSIYVWDGKVEHGRECQLLIKTRKSKFDELSRFITDNHPYELPEIIEVPISNGLPNYLSWINSVVAQ